MTESTRRVLRTIYQLVVALITIAPLLVTLLAGTPVEVQVGVFAGWVAAVAAIINKLEDAGLLPAWLKSGPSLVDDIPHADRVVATTSLAAIKARAYLRDHPDLTRVLKADLRVFATESLGQAVRTKATKQALIDLITAAAKGA